MFNVKFYKSTDDGVSQDSISCQSYNVYTRSNGSVTITTYPKMTPVDGVERHVSSDPKHFDSCYVENMAGKTVEVFRADNKKPRIG